MRRRSSSLSIPFCSHGQTLRGREGRGPAKVAADGIAVNSKRRDETVDGAATPQHRSAQSHQGHRYRNENGSPLESRGKPADEFRCGYVSVIAHIERSGRRFSRFDTGAQRVDEVAYIDDAAPVSDGPEWQRDMIVDGLHESKKMALRCDRWVSSLRL